MALTLAGLAAAVILFLLATYMGRRPKADDELRWIPYSGVQFVAILIIVLAGAHLVTLLTGQQLIGRFAR